MDGQVLMRAICVLFLGLEHGSVRLPMTTFETAFSICTNFLLLYNTFPQAQELRVAPTLSSVSAGPQPGHDATLLSGLSRLNSWYWPGP